MSNTSKKPIAFWQRANYYPVPGCMCGRCGDRDNRPRPHNLASFGPHRTVNEDVFEFCRTHRRFTHAELDRAMTWATANGFTPSLRSLRRRGLIDWHYERATKCYVITRVEGEPNETQEADQ